MSTLFYQIPSYIVFVPNLTMSGEKSTLSDAALRVLDACVTAYRRAGRTVSAKEVGLEIGITSQAVLKQVAFLLVAGKVESTGVHYGLRPLIDSKGQPVELPEVAHLPILGYAAAGQPIEAVDSDPDTLALPSEWCQRPSYLLRVRGDSMIGDGIHDGDLVLVEATDHVQTGAIHVCWLPGDGATLKRVKTKADAAELVASNTAFAPIPAPHGTIVQGRVAWVLRRMGIKKKQGRTSEKSRNDLTRLGLPTRIAKYAHTQHRKWRRRLPEMTDAEIAAGIFAARYAFSPKPPLSDVERHRFLPYIGSTFAIESLYDFCLASLDIEGGINPDDDLYLDAAEQILEQLIGCGQVIAMPHPILAVQFRARWRETVRPLRGLP